MKIQTLLYIFYHTHRSFLVQKETQQGSSFFSGYKCWHNKAALRSCNDNSVVIMTAMSSCKYYEHAFNFIHNTCDVC